MIDEADIRRVAVQIGEMTHAEQVILFGSYARGEATEDSDVDLLVVAASSAPRFRRSRELYRRLRPYPFSMDLLVYTPDEVERARHSPASFLHQVLLEGRPLYAREA